MCGHKMENYSQYVVMKWICVLIDLEGDCNKYLEHTTEKIKFPGYMPVKASILLKKKW